MKKIAISLILASAIQFANAQSTTPLHDNMQQDTTLNGTKSKDNSNQKNKQGSGTYEDGMNHDNKNHPNDHNNPQNDSLNKGNRNNPNGTNKNNPNNTPNKDNKGTKTQPKDKIGKDSIKSGHTPK
ncbi:MAG: hypothetical protein M3R27_04845 [Bacteroidota bacterium]|nr:hypothetical protein [Bacteroidota bacterium]